jgi:hypothetical protein
MIGAGHHVRRRLTTSTACTGHREVKIARWAVLPGAIRTRTDQGAGRSAVIHTAIARAALIDHVADPLGPAVP